jgi:hypothetical protein
VLTAVAEERRDRMRERDLLGHLTHAEADPDTPEPGDGDEATDDAAGEAEGGEGDRDVVLARAVEVLKSWRYFEGLRDRRQPTLRAALDVDPAVEPAAAPEPGGPSDEPDGDGAPDGGA